MRVSFWAKEFDGVEEVVQAGGKRVETDRAWSIEEDEAVDSLTLSNCLQCSFVGAYTAGRPTPECVWAVRLTPTHFGKVKGGDTGNANNIILRGFHEGAVEPVDGEIRR